MAYGINSNIQAVELVDSTGGVTGQKSLSIPLTARTLLISSQCDFILAFSYEDLFIEQKRMVFPGQFTPTGLGVGPLKIPAPSGTNGQLWVVAYDAGAIVPDPNSYLSLMVLE